MKKIVLLLVPLLAFIAGAFGGDMLQAGKKPDSAQAAGDASHETAEPAKAEPEPAAEGHEAPAADAGHGDAGHGEAAEGEGQLDWFKFPSQFFVPILRNGTPTAIMVLTLTVEMPSSARPRIEAQEHRLRDALLNALLIEANTGGFDGNFTADPAQQRLRSALLAAAQAAAGSDVQRILIEDIGRQEQ
ncbi:hypothetical protein [Paracoccus sp. DMF]|uniref:hypothetical protein n=1 Tax=Paracoccus sp. DMF TaxID=400837 RepID=UPI0021E3CA93|nr:hypothetical protein [Paracoccus sp. DMF]MCV2447942.1 hypothetical protein [Paracoccus sp. DMF]